MYSAFLKCPAFKCFSNYGQNSVKCTFSHALVDKRLNRNGQGHNCFHIYAIVLWKTHCKQSKGMKQGQFPGIQNDQPKPVA